VTRAKDLALLRLLCSSGADLMSQMPLLSECLHRLVPSFSLSMIRVDERCVPTAHYSEFFSEESHALFAMSGDHFATRSPDPAAFANLMSNPSPVGSLVHAGSDYVDGMIYQHLFQPNGIHHTLDVALRDGAEPLAILGVFREKRAPGFSREHVQLLRSVYDHLVHACRAEVTPGAFDELGSAMIVVDAQGRIAWASEAARAWLAEASFGSDRALLVEQGLVPEACRALLGMVRHARSVSRGGQAPAPHLSIPVPGGRVSLRGYALEGHPGAAEGYVGVQIALEMDHRIRTLRALSTSGLTAQQMRIAWGMLEGKGNAELCVDLELGASTLKSYQKDMYRRLDVTSARELTLHMNELTDRVTLSRSRHQPGLHATATQ